MNLLPLLKRARSQGLGLSSLSVLIFLKDGESYLTLIADRIKVSSACMTGLLDNMAKQGLVSRGFDSTDRRRIVAKLTRKGENVLAAVVGVDGREE